MVPILYDLEYTPKYYQARHILPEPGALVEVAFDHARCSFLAVRYGRKWELMHRNGNDWKNFYAMIQSNDWWKYWE